MHSDRIRRPNCDYSINLRGDRGIVLIMSDNNSWLVSWLANNLFCWLQWRRAAQRVRALGNEVMRRAGNSSDVRGRISRIHRSSVCSQQQQQWIVYFTSRSRLRLGLVALAVNLFIRGVLIANWFQRFSSATSAATNDTCCSRSCCIY